MWIEEFCRSTGQDTGLPASRGVFKTTKTYFSIFVCHILICKHILLFTGGEAGSESYRAFESIWEYCENKKGEFFFISPSVICSKWVHTLYLKYKNDLISVISWGQHCITFWVSMMYSDCCHRSKPKNSLCSYQPFVILSNLCTGGPEADADCKEQRVQADAAAWKNEAEKPVGQTDHCILTIRCYYLFFHWNYIAVNWKSSTDVNSY